LNNESLYSLNIADKKKYKLNKLAFFLYKDKRMKVGKDQIALIPFPTNKKFNLLGVKISILSIVGYPEIGRGS